MSGGYCPGGGVVRGDIVLIPSRGDTTKDNAGSQNIRAQHLLFCEGSVLKDCSSSQRRRYLETCRPDFNFFLKNVSSVDHMVVYYCFCYRK